MGRSRIQKPAERRQVILDFLNRNGRSTIGEIIADTGYERRTVQTYLREMRLEHEIVSDEMYEGKVCVWHYTAVATSPGYRPQVGTPNDDDRTVTLVLPGYVRHNGMNRAHPLPAQGGQGGGTGPRQANCLMSMG
jgi:hypothetical protein